MTFIPFIYNIVFAINNQKNKISNHKDFLSFTHISSDKNNNLRNDSVIGCFITAYMCTIDRILSYSRILLVNKIITLYSEYKKKKINFPRSEIFYII